MWLIDMIAKLLAQKAEPDPNGTYRHPKIAVIVSEAKQSFWPGINHLEIAASLAGRSGHPASRGTYTSLYIVLAKTAVWSSSKCHSILTPISF
jgi:hypothetical protein